MKQYIQFLIFVFLFAATLGSFAQAETIRECNAPKGVSYFPNTATSDEWEDDGFSNGFIALTIKDKSEVDIIYRDLTGIHSLRADGVTLDVIGTGEHSLSILAKHNQMVHELYSFDLKNNRLFISQHKLEVLVDKVSSFQSVCK